MSFKGVFNYYVTIAIGMTLILFLMNGVAAQQIDSCTVINFSGYYNFSRDIYNMGNSAVSTCINITSNDVVLDGQNFSIIGGSTSTYTIGVQVHNETKSLTNVTVKNLQAKNLDEGIFYENTAEGIIANNNVTSNKEFGIHLQFSNNSKIEKNNVSFNGRGIRIFSSHNNILDKNIVSFSNFSGIKLDEGSSYNNILENTVNNSKEGNGIVLAFGSNNNILESNRLNSNNGDGIFAFNCSYNKIHNNTARSNNWAGIAIVESCNNNYISNNTLILNREVGIKIREQSNFNTVIDNIITSNEAGIDIISSHNNDLSGNFINSNNRGGIKLEASINNNILKNNVNDNENGIWIWESSNNNISTNSFLSNKNGIWMVSNSNYNILSANNVSDNILHNGIGMQDSSNNIITGNTLLSNNETGIWMDNNSNYNLLSGNTVSHTVLYNGIGMRSSSKNKIIGNNLFSNNHNGIWMESNSNYNLLSGNNISYSMHNGIGLRDSSNNDITGNTLFSNNQSGLMLENSTHNNIIDNNLNTNNNLGVQLYYSNYNILFHNTFIYNSLNAFDNSLNNLWDNGYPAGGNYWSDYTGIDTMKGPGQNIAGSDGIGDISYNNIGGGTGNVDRYPFMQMDAGWIVGDVTYVDCTRSGPGSGTFTDPYASIQNGINSASGTLVKVAPGTCTANVSMKNGIFLLGAGPDTTTIEGNVMAWNINYARISNFTITDNDTAGIHSYYSTLTMTNNIIRGQPHNGIHSNNSFLTIINNVLSGNGHDGISIINQSVAFIRNNILVHNGQVGVGSDGTSSAVIDYNDVWNNTLGSYGGGLSDGTHDLNLDPQFISSSNFRLQPASPAINAGDPSSIYNDADGGRNDMGAFGGHIIAKSDVPRAQFALDKNFIVGTDLDSLSKGIHIGDFDYYLDINNFDDTSDTVLGNIKFDAKADNITNVGWMEYAIWNKTSANWTFPADRLIYENQGFGTDFKTNYTESRTINVSLNRWMNETIFSTSGYQLVKFNVTFENKDFEWAWARIEVNNRNEVNVYIVKNSFTGDAPGNYNTWENGIHFDFDKYSIQPGKVYNFSVVVKVDLTGREAPPIQFKPQFSVGMGTYFNSTVSKGFKAEMPADMLPDKIRYASTSSNVNNTWLLKRHDHNIAQLEEVSKTIGPRAQFTINKNFLYGTDSDSLSSGIYEHNMKYDLNIDNRDDDSNTILGNIRFSANADNITNVDWKEYATWNKTSVNWSFPPEYFIRENQGFGTGFNNNRSELRSVNVNISRWMNNTAFTAESYQLAKFNVSFNDKNFEWAWARIEANNRYGVEASIVPGTFVNENNAPGQFDVWNNGIHFNFYKQSIQTGVNYSFSVIIKVRPTGEIKQAISYKPEFFVGEGLFQNFADGGTGTGVEVPSGMLPENIYQVTASTNVSNTWLIVSQGHNIAVLGRDVTPPVITDFKVEPNTSISTGNPGIASANVSDENLGRVEFGIIDANNLVGTNMTMLAVYFNESGVNGKYTSIPWNAISVQFGNGTINETITPLLHADFPENAFVFGNFKKNATSGEEEAVLIFNKTTGKMVDIKKRDNTTVQIVNGISTFRPIISKFVNGINNAPVNLMGSSFLLYDPGSSNNPELIRTSVPSGTYRVFIHVTDAQGYENGDVVDVSVSQVVVKPFPGISGAPNDLNGDGLYEDINGNRKKDFNDVVLFFNYLEWVAGNEPISGFDFNRNGRIDFNDIVRMFEGM